MVSSTGNQPTQVGAVGEEGCRLCGADGGHQLGGWGRLVGSLVSSLVGAAASHFCVFVGMNKRQVHKDHHENWLLITVNLAGIRQ